MRKMFLMPVAILSLAATAACGSQTNASDTADANGVDIVGNWDIDTRESHIQFSATQQGETFTGGFSDFTVDINFDPDNIDAASVKAVIDLGSVDAGDSDRNSALPGKDWFYVKKYPQAVFTSDDFQAVADGEYEANGELTIRDVTRPATLPFNLDIVDDQAVMSSKLKLNRSDYGVGQGTWKTDEWVSLDVEVDIKVTANRG